MPRSYFSTGAAEVPPSHSLLQLVERAVGLERVDSVADGSGQRPSPWAARRRARRRGRGVGQLTHDLAVVGERPRRGRTAVGRSTTIASTWPDCRAATASSFELKTLSLPVRAGRRHLVAVVGAHDTHGDVLQLGDGRGGRSGRGARGDDRLGGRVVRRREVDGLLALVGDRELLHVHVPVLRAGGDRAVEVRARPTRCRPSRSQLLLGDGARDGGLEPSHDAGSSFSTHGEKAGSPVAMVSLPAATVCRAPLGRGGGTGVGSGRGEGAGRQGDDDRGRRRRRSGRRRGAGVRKRSRCSPRGRIGVIPECCDVHSVPSACFRGCRR